MNRIRFILVYWLSGRKKTTSIHSLVVPLVLLSFMLSFAGWISFDDEALKRSITDQDIVRCTDLKVEQRGFNVSITIPGAYEFKPDDFGLLAGKYSVLTLYGSALEIVSQNINGSERPERLGQPNLPYARFHVLIPSSLTIDQLSITVGNTQFRTVSGTWDVAPIQEELFDSFIPGVHRDDRIFQRDMNIYTRDVFFSQPLEYEINICHGYKILEIRYCPIQYNPVTKKILATPTAQLTVSYKETPVNNVMAPNSFTNAMYKVAFDGITGLKKRASQQVPRGGKFVVISADPLINCATMDEFISYHEGQGYEHVTTLNADNLSSSEITRELQNLYDSEKIEYVQVIGDDDLIESPTGGSSYHYKDWARFDGDDSYEDVCLGIYLCHDEQGFEYILNRQKWHEEGGDWSKTIINTLGQQEEENPLARFSSGHYATRNWDKPGDGLGYTVHRVYKINVNPTQGYGGGYSIPGPFPWEDWALTPDPFYTTHDEACDKIYELWNEGAFCVFHRDHGSNSGPSSPRIRMSSTITAKNSPLFISCNCLSGNFKDRHSSNFAYLTQCKEIGTITTIAAPVTTSSGDNDRYTMAIFAGMVPEDGSPPERRVGMYHILGSAKSGSKSRTYFHNLGDVMTWLSIGDLKPFISVTTPGEVEQNTTCTVSWSDNIDGNVKIDILKGGSVAEVLASSTESDGAFEWNVPADFPLGTDYTLKITSIDSTALSHTSNTFSIVPEFLITEFPYVQNMDDLEVGSVVLPEKWEQTTDDDIEWLVLSGPTPSKVGSSPDITGPDGDHTSGDGNYIYIEASDPNNPEKRADFITPKFNLTVCNNPHLSFWCHMFSANNEMGHFYLDISVDGTWHNEVIHLTDDHGDAWFEATQDLAGYVGERVIFRFRGISGVSWASDICLDDFQIQGNATPVVPIASALPSTYDVKYYGSQVRFQIPPAKTAQSNTVLIQLYSMQGKMVKTLVNGHVKAGYYTINLGNIDIASGMYHCMLKTKNFVKTIGIALIR